MKGLCYVALILIFIMFYKTNPMYCLVIVGLFVGVFIFFKSRKYRAKGATNTQGILFRRHIPQQNSNVNDFITFLILQQMMSDFDKNNEIIDYDEHKEKVLEIDKVKNEFLDLLNE